ncbi:MAG: hypothetical protein HOY76_13430, partial [Streptomyces sp.]|nr:hypothetical protein [Streptomyces sp.]
MTPPAAVPGGPASAVRQLAAGGRDFATGPYPLLVLGITLLALVLAVWGLHAWRGGRADRVALVERLAAELGETGGPIRSTVPFAWLDRRVRRQAWGRRLAGRLAATGTDLTPGQFTAASVGVVAGAWVAAAVVFAPFFGPIAALIA